jgi:choline-glycine betaine transporter
MRVINVATDRAVDRLDLVKRLFAVAISIGVGNTLVNATWVRSGVLPAGHEIEQIFIVLFALSATVLSWDGYLASVRQKPLNDWWRFATDV